jgi:hypothetical protein
MVVGMLVGTTGKLIFDRFRSSRKSNSPDRISEILSLCRRIKEIHDQELQTKLKEIKEALIDLKCKGNEKQRRKK